MIVQDVNTGEKADYVLDGTNLLVEVPEIGSLDIDLAQKQRETSRTINISLDRNFERLAEGVGAWYIANIKIPGIEYEVVDTGEVDEDGNPVMEKNRLPLDTSKVELHLWGFPETLSEKINEIEEENN